MKNLLFTLALLSLAACSGDPQKSAERSAQSEANAPLSAQQGDTSAASITNHSHPYSRDQGRAMAWAFRNKVGTAEIQNLSFPKSLIIEKTQVLNLLQELDASGGTGGLILYPVVEPSTGAFSLAVTAASFATDSDGNYSSGPIDVKYPVIGGVPSVMEHLFPCPTHCPEVSTDLYTE